MPAVKAKPAGKGDTLECSVCGLAVVVDEACGCAEAHEIICCEVPMQRRARAARSSRARPRTAAKTKAPAKAKR